ncbi:uncharacterized protein LOC141902750 [Tubulanus polymorphus]|uniref:uncharacterized protein LOC141902750 n=1 Tax=Tubulanus polymorphus TaxID=672921 RepID=UPI003DA372AE
MSDSVCPETFTLYVCFKPKNGSKNLKRSLITWSTGNAANDPQIYSLNKRIGYLNHESLRKFPTSDWSFIEWTKFASNNERICRDEVCTDITDGGVYNNGSCDLVIGSGNYEGFVKHVYLFDEPLRKQYRWLRDVCTEVYIERAKSKFPKMTLDELCELWTYGWPHAKPCLRGRFPDGEKIKHQKFSIAVTYADAQRSCLALGMDILNNHRCLDTGNMDDYPDEFWQHSNIGNGTICETLSKHATEDKFIKSKRPCGDEIPFVCVEKYYRFPSRTGSVLHELNRKVGICNKLPENDGEATYGCMFKASMCN